MKEKIIPISIILLIISAAFYYLKTEKKEDLIIIPKDSVLVDKIEIKDKLYCLPAPQQAADLVKKNSEIYRQDLLNSSTNLIRYTNSFKQALNLGVFGVNLCYSVVYEKHDDAIKNLIAIKKLSKELELPIDWTNQTIKLLSSKHRNTDSLLIIINNLYYQTDALLYESKRHDIAMLIIVGAWIESIYLLNEINKEDPKEIFKKRIAQQKQNLENLIAIMRPYYKKHTPEFLSLFRQLVEIASIFEGVQIKYKYDKEPENDSIKDIVIIHSNTKTIITDYQIKTIRDSIFSIRNQIIN